MMKHFYIKCTSSLVQGQGVKVIDNHSGRYLIRCARGQVQVCYCGLAGAAIKKTITGQTLHSLVSTYGGCPGGCPAGWHDKGGTPLLYLALRQGGNPSYLVNQQRQLAMAGLFNSFLKYSFLTISHTGISHGHPSNYLCKHLYLTSIIGQDPTQSLCYGISYKVMYNIIEMYSSQIITK